MSGALAGQAWQAGQQEQEHDAQMRDAVEPLTVRVPNAKRQATSNLANERTHEARGREVRPGVEGAQRAAQAVLGALRQQTEHTFLQVTARVYRLEVGAGVVEQGKAVQTHIDGLAADVRRLGAEMRRAPVASSSDSGSGPFAGASIGGVADTPEGEAFDIGRKWSESVKYAIPVCQDKLTSAGSLRFRSPAGAREAVEHRRPLAGNFSTLR